MLDIPPSLCALDAPSFDAPRLLGTLDMPIANPHMNGDVQERHDDGPREYQDFQHVQGEIEHKGGTDPNAYEGPNDCDPLGESGHVAAWTQFVVDRRHTLRRAHDATPEELRTAFEDEVRKRFS